MKSDPMQLIRLHSLSNEQLCHTKTLIFTSIPLHRDCQLFEYANHRVVKRGLDTTAFRAKRAKHNIFQIQNELIETAVDQIFY